MVFSNYAHRVFGKLLHVQMNDSCYWRGYTSASRTRRKQHFTNTLLSNQLTVIPDTEVIAHSDVDDVDVDGVIRQETGHFTKSP